MARKREGHEHEDYEEEGQKRGQQYPEKNEGEGEERHPFKLNRDLHVRDQAHRKGDTLYLTREEYDQLAPMGVFEGEEEKNTPEQVEERTKQAHEEGTEAQKKRMEEGPGVPEGADEPKEEGFNERAERERREQTDPNAGLRPPVPTPPKSF